MSIGKLAIRNKKFVMILLSSEILAQKMFNDNIDMEDVIDNVKKILNTDIEDLYLSIMRDTEEMSDGLNKSEKFDYISNVIDELM